MSDLAEFLLARIAEEEGRAERAIDGDVDLWTDILDQPVVQLPGDRLRAAFVTALYRAAGVARGSGATRKDNEG